MLGVMSGDVPLKQARVIHSLGELSLRGSITQHEYEQGQPLRLLPASVTAVDEMLGTSRKA